MAGAGMTAAGKGGRGNDGQGTTGEDGTDGKRELWGGGSGDGVAVPCPGHILHVFWLLLGASSKHPPLIF